MCGDYYGDPSEWGYCPDCEVVGALEKLEEQNAEQLKEIAELKGQLNAIEKTEAKRLVDAIGELDKRSEKEEYLDSEEAWNLLLACREVLEMLY